MVQQHGLAYGPFKPIDGEGSNVGLRCANDRFRGCISLILLRIFETAHKKYKKIGKWGVRSSSGIFLRYLKRK